MYAHAWETHLKDHLFNLPCSKQVSAIHHQASKEVNRAVLRLVSGALIEVKYQLLHNDVKLVSALPKMEYSPHKKN